MERIGTIPISSATNTTRRGSARLNTKPPVGPLNVTAAPGSSARTHCEPMPPGATSIESVRGPFRVGDDTMLQARTFLGPKGTEIHCPASKVKSAGSRILRSTSMISGVSDRTAGTSDRHSRGFIRPPSGDGGRGVAVGSCALLNARDDLTRDHLQLGALVGGISDGVHHEVAAAGLCEAPDLLGAVIGRADHPVLAGQRTEVLRVPVLDGARPC